MKKKPLYNFDHGIDQEWEFNVGPFRIRINQQHVKNRVKLKSYEGRRRGSEAGIRTITIKPAVKGGYYETAIVEYDEQEIFPPKLMKEIPGRSQFNDLLDLLSFLTGRRIYTKEKIRERPSIEINHSFVKENIFKNKSADYWDKLDKIEKSKLSYAFDACINAIGVKDLIGRSAYFYTALDVISSRWYSKHGKNKLSKNENRLISKNEEKIKEDFKKILIENGLAESTADQLAARCIKREPAALDIQKEFLTEHGFYPKAETSESLLRLKAMNTLRNGITHTATIRVPNQYSKKEWIRRGSISASLSSFVSMIVLIYFHQAMLGIDAFPLDDTKRLLLRFFTHGLYGEIEVFEESVEEYMRRQEQEWLGGIDHFPLVFDED